jgi:hypothetical protein
MLEAMSTGCVVIGSDTAPVREVIIDGETGILVPFFDLQQWADQIVEVLSAPKRFAGMRRAARAFIQTKFDADKICVPRLLSLLQTDPAKNGHQPAKPAPAARPPLAEPQPAKPQSAKPPPAKPQQARPQQAKPHQAKPHQAKPQQTGHQQTRSHQASSQQADALHIKPDEAAADQTAPQRSDDTGLGPPRLKRVWPGKSRKVFRKTAAPPR